MMGMLQNIQAQRVRVVLQVLSSLVRKSGSK